MFVIIKNNKIIGSNKKELLGNIVNVDSEFLFINKTNYFIKNKEEFLLEIPIFSESVIIKATKYELKEQIKEENSYFIKQEKNNIFQENEENKEEVFPGFIEKEKQNIIKEKKEKIINDDKIPSFVEKEETIDNEEIPSFIEKEKTIDHEEIPSFIEKEEIIDNEEIPSFIEKEEIINNEEIPSFIEKEETIDHEEVPSFIEESIFMETEKKGKTKDIDKSFEEASKEEYEEEIELELTSEDKEVEKILNKNSKELKEIINKELKDAIEEMGLDDMDMLNELWVDLLKQIETEKKNFYKGIKDINYDLLHETAHKLKGAALNLRISSFANVLKYIDELSKKKEDIIIIKRYVDNFYQLLEKFKSSELDIKLSKSKILFLNKFLKDCSENKVRNNLDFLSKFLNLDKNLINSCEKLKEIIKKQR